jgi:integrase
MQITKDMISRYENALSLKTQATQETYSYILNKFFNTTGTDIDRDKILSFISSYPKNSRITIYYAIKFFLKNAGLEIPLKYSDIAPKGIERIRESMTYEEVERLINYCKTLNNYVTGIFSLSTTYGLRRTEIIKLKKEDIDIERRTIKITALKSVESKYLHKIPDEIVTYLETYLSKIDKVNALQPQTLNALFDRVCHDAGIQLRPRLGFHSIRRSLVTELRKRDVPKDVVETFMRWTPLIKSMVDVYDIKDRQNVDERIFNVHPFLQLWK